MAATFLYDLILRYDSRIFNTVSFVNLQRLDLSPFTPFLSPILNACIVFSLTVHHSKFCTLLSILIPFLWFTNGLFSGLGINANATNLCRATDFSNPTELVISTRMYPYLVGFGLRNLFNRTLQSLPKDDVLYRPSYPIVDFNISFFIKKVLPLNQKDCGRNLRDKEAIKYLKYVLPQTNYMQIY